MRVEVLLDIVCNVHRDSLGLVCRRIVSPCSGCDQKGYRHTGPAVSDVVVEEAKHVDGSAVRGELAHVHGEVVGASVVAERTRVAQVHFADVGGKIEEGERPADVLPVLGDVLADELVAAERLLVLLGTKERLDGVEVRLAALTREDTVERRRRAVENKLSMTRHE